MKRSKARKSRQRKARQRKARLGRRLERRPMPEDGGRVLRGGNIEYDVSDRVDGLPCGGLGAIQLMVNRLGLPEAIDRKVQLLKMHLPYHESDHVLNMAYNVLAGGTCLEDLELRRNDEVYMDSLNAERIPDPTTAGDFCRRFSPGDVDTLMDAINEVRLKVWQSQPDEFFDEAFIDVDGAIVSTFGECKEGMGLTYDGQWGYHPLTVTLANTSEVLFKFNRSGERPSHEGAWKYLDKAAELCRRAGFRKITFRGDTDFSQTAHLDRWDREGIRFIFGMDAGQALREKADNLPEEWWSELERGPRYTVKTEPRQRPANVKQRIVREKAFLNLRLKSEDVSDFDHQPVKCSQSYDVVAVRKNISRERGELRLFDDIRYLFYITNDRTLATEADIVRLANGRCNQENIIDQLKHGVHSLRAPLGDLTSNWAYMVIASLAWNLKIWFALLLPETGRWGAKYKAQKQAVLKMEFKKFLNSFMLVPCQLVRQARRLIFRLLSWNRWQEVLFRFVEAMRCPLRC